MKKVYSVMLMLALCGTMLSCEEDFLEQPPVGAFSESILNTPAGINQALIGAYSPLNGASNMSRGPAQTLFGSVRGGEAHKGSSSGDQPQMIEIQKFAVTSGNSSVTEFFAFYYDAVFRCNLVLQKLPTIESGLTDAERTEIEAEARFLRGHYHFMLKRLFKNIPFIDETVVDPRVPNTDESGNYVDIWPNILADFKFASDNLPQTQTDPGRPNKWAAKSYYAKALVYTGNEGDDSNYALAKTEFDDIIANGVTNKGVKYALSANYHDNFNSQTENGPESVFAVQHSVNDGSTNNDANANLEIQYIGSQSGTGPALGRGYGFFYPTQWFVNHFRVNANGLPIFDDATRAANKIISDDGLESTAPFTPDTGPIDPRLDWSVGRRGIPYLDYGLMPGKTWIRDQAAAGPYISKKYFTLKSRNGIDTAPGRPFNSLNVDIIRYDDVLLLAAEVEARLGNVDQARIYVNQIRNRMVTNATSPENWVLTSTGAPAANYKIGLYSSGAFPFDNTINALKAIFFERTLELGLEGHRAYDAIRFGYEDGTTDVDELNNYIEYESSLKGYLSGAIYTKIPDSIMPIPQQSVDNSFKDGAITLKQNPGY